MSFIEAVQSGFKNYFNFTGTSTRAEYWLWYLFNVLVILVATLFDTAFLGYEFSDSGPFYIVTGLLLFIPSFSIFFRRLRDADRSALNFFWLFLPVIGVFIVLWILIQPTERSGYDYSWSR